ncbi:uncharacterized protein LOC117115919 [Anneissia japonica]|uniref:uncharacterized protein LOC117115919 n=1 Tax=Anneissia japonica TaxID=1529436 RepID=UPI001425B150|nr:uncharacterized protein LOC117115919 [Anneissia japonica]
MKVHIFGNRPSPAVATLGLRRTAKEGESEFGSDARAFVESNFYVDDGLKSFASAREAVDLLTRTRNMLATANIKLHKIASNDKEVMAAFAPSDLAPNVQEVDLGSDAPVMQRSLGVYWDMRSDTFTYKILQANGEPSTKRAVLSEINSMYDPLGFAAPVIIEGKMLLREIIGENKVGWDEPLPQQPLEAWKKWRSSVNELSQVNIPRAYTPFPAKEAVRRELHIFGDASSRAISAVSYLRSVNKSGKAYVSFVLGKSKLAPKAATTIPRMELCAAVLGTDVSELAVTELDLKIDAVYFYTDSKVVMGYITNRTRRFYLYVSNRVARILRVSKPEYWKYIPTAMNPADVGSRSIKAKDLQNSPWLQGPTFLHKSSLPPSLETDETNYDDDLDNDPEVRNTVSAYATEVKMTGVLESHRFNRFSSWLKLLRAIASLILLANKSKRKANVISDKDRYALAANIVIRTVQHEAFGDEISSLKAGKNLSSSSSLVKLNPVLDSEALLRIGGRVTAASDLTFTEKHPLIIPKKTHVTSLLVTHYHQEVVHQGRHLTEGAVHAAGYWIIGGKQVVSRLIYSCVTCRKLRGKFQVQKMADLPTERLAQDPPFTYVGLDVWGPWSVVARRTRGGLAQSKRWAVLFTCMCSRAVHIECIESMDASSLINALRRFQAIRGPIKQLRSDCGTNFIGACSELQASLQESGLSKVKKYLLDKNCEWIFNTPHSSHMGGVWERMIGVARRILEGMFKTLRVTSIFRSRSSDCSFSEHASHTEDFDICGT